MYKQLFAWALAHSNRRIDARTADRKRELLTDLRGTVVEIGPGVGSNLPYFHPDVRWIGIEPNPYMHGYLRDRAARLGMAVELRGQRAEVIDLPDGSADAVASTLVLCSVAEPTAALSEALRILRPGGRFVFVEHVAAPGGSATRRVQDVVQPLWTPVGDGCHPNRETWRIIEQAGFSTVDLRHFSIDAPIVGSHIMGVAVK